MGRRRQGKIVDLLSDRFDVVARYHGGHNAGHTVKFGVSVISRSTSSSGIVRGRPGAVGPGVVVDPEALLSEIEAGIGRDPRLRQAPPLRSGSGHPSYHRLLDAAREKAAETPRSGRRCEESVRHTSLRPRARRESRRPAATDILLRRVEALAPEIRGPRRARLQRQPRAERGRDTARKAGSAARAVRRRHRALSPRQAQRRRPDPRGRAHGAMLDIIAGTYPYVTSSTCTVRLRRRGASDSAAVSGRFPGCTKAYSTRVGSGPFPTEPPTRQESFFERGQRIRDLDRPSSPDRMVRLVVARTAVELSGGRGSGHHEARRSGRPWRNPVCVGYRLGGRVPPMSRPLWKIRSGSSPFTRPCQAGRRRLRP